MRIHPSSRERVIASRICREARPTAPGGWQLTQFPIGSTGFPNGTVGRQRSDRRHRLVEDRERPSCLCAYRVSPVRGQDGQNLHGLGDVSAQPDQAESPPPTCGFQGSPAPPGGTPSRSDRLTGPIPRSRDTMDAGAAPAEGGRFGPAANRRRDDGRARGLHRGSGRRRVALSPSDLGPLGRRDERGRRPGPAGDARRDGGVRARPCPRGQAAPPGYSSIWSTAIIPASSWLRTWQCRTVLPG